MSRMFGLILLEFLWDRCEYFRRSLPAIYGQMEKFHVETKMVFHSLSNPALKIFTLNSIWNEEKLLMMRSRAMSNRLIIVCFPASGDCVRQSTGHIFDIDSQSLIKD